MEKKFNIVRSIFLTLVGYLLASLFSTILCFLLTIVTNGAFYGASMVIVHTSIMGLLLVVYDLILLKKEMLDLKFNTFYGLLVVVVFTIIFEITQASLLHPLLSITSYLAFPFFPTYIFMALFSNTYGTMMSIGITLLCGISIPFILTKRYKLLSLSGICLGAGIVCLITYFNSPNYKYAHQSHGFEYMGGYSSIDLSDYSVYSDSNKLNLLAHDVDFMIEKEVDMPVLDGAEACYPVYSALAKTLYKDIEHIEKDYRDRYETKYQGDYTYENGKIVTFYNTAVGFDRLLSGEVDLFFGAKPSSSQLEQAKQEGIELELTPIGKEAFVFFVEEDNPIDGLTSDEIRKIYSGEITNWKEVGGKDQTIVAFQRPERSGSQSMMVYFMGDMPLKEPLTYEMEYAMMGIVEEVAQYENEAGALGYTFRYFLEGLNQVEGVKMLKVDGIYPSRESISNGTYPIVTSLYCISNKNTTLKTVGQVIDFLLSEDGQTLIELNGYSRLGE